MFLDPFRKHVCFREVERIDLAVQDWGGIRFKVDCVVVFPCGRKSLCFLFRKYFGMSLVFVGDCLKVFVLVSLNCPFLGKIGSVDNYFITFFPFVCPDQSAMHVLGRSDKIGCQLIFSRLLCRAQVQRESIGCMLSPVNFRVEFVEPGESQDEAVGSQVGDIESLDSYLHSSGYF